MAYKMRFCSIHYRTHKLYNSFLLSDYQSAQLLTWTLYSLSCYIQISWFHSFQNWRHKTRDRLMQSPCSRHHALPVETPLVTPRCLQAYASNLGYLSMTPHTCLLDIITQDLKVCVKLEQAQHLAQTHLVPENW